MNFNSNAFCVIGKEIFKKKIEKLWPQIYCRWDLEL